VAQSVPAGGVELQGLAALTGIDCLEQTVSVVTRVGVGQVSTAGSVPTVISFVTGVIG
jgi:hypothetical protein